MGLCCHLELAMDFTTQSHDRQLITIMPHAGHCVATVPILLLHLAQRDALDTVFVTASAKA